MVTRLRGRTGAQVLLAGSVVLAVILIGLVVVVNGTYVTQSAVPSEASPQIEDAREFDYESRKGARSIALRLNHHQRNVTASELGDIAARNVTTYSQLLAESFATSRGSYANVTYHNASSAFGRRIVQVASDNVTDNDDNGDSGDWEMIGTSEQRQIGWFTMNVDVEETSEAPGNITVSNGSRSVTFEINRTASGAVGVTSAAGSGGETFATCAPSNGRVLLDLRSGETFTGDCQFDGTTAIAPPYSVSVDDGKNLVASYELAVNDSVVGPGSAPAPGYPACDSSVGGDASCLSPAIWTANVSTQFIGSEIDYANDFNVSVYEGDR